MPRSDAIVALLPLLGALACPLALEVPPGARIACAVGPDCPAGLACLADEGRCVGVDDACVDVDAVARSAAAAEDGERCTTDDGEIGVCRAGGCGGACGDGVVDTSAGELCDLGGLNSDDEADACRTDCLPPRCGDGVVDRGESCDDDDDTCDGCLAVCRLETVDGDGEAGCEEPLRPAFFGDGFLVEPVFVDDGGLPTVVYGSIADGDREIRRLDLDTGADTLVFDCPDFCRPVAARRLIAFVMGSAAEVYLLRDGVPRLLFDGSSAQAMSDEGLYVERTDGNTSFLSRTDLATFAETRLDGDVGFPPALAVTASRVVYLTASGALAARPLGGGPKEILTTEIINPTVMTADGDDLWVLDGLEDLWLIEAGGDVRRVLERPAALAGTRGESLSIRDGTWAISWSFSGESLEDSDDVGSLVVGDASGAHAMRARARGRFSGVFVGDNDVLAAGDGIVRVSR